MTQLISVLFFLGFCVMVSLVIAWAVRRPEHLTIHNDSVKLDQYQVEKFVRSYKEAR